MDAKLICQIDDFLVILLEVQGKAGCVETDEDIFGHGLIFDQHKMLMDHANSSRNRISWRTEVHLFTVDADFTRLGFVETGKHIHQAAFAGTIFA